MADFTKYRIDEVCEFTNGFAFKSGDYIERSKETLEVFRMGYIERGGGFKEDSTPVFVPKNYGIDLSKYLLRKDDVLIAMTDMKNNVAILANTARVKDEGRFVLNQRVGCLRVIDKNLLDPTFFYFYSNFKPHVEYLRSRANSGVQVNLSTSSIKEAEILVPPLTEQKTIASVLGALDDKIENNRQMNETLEEMARAIFKSWFVDFDPVHAKAAGNAPAHMDAETAALFPSSFDDDGLPVGWNLHSLGDVTEKITKGTTPAKKDLNGAREEPCTINFLKVNNISDDGYFNQKSFEKIPKSVHSNQLKRSILKEGDVLYSIAGTIGRVIIVNDDILPSNTNQALAILRPKDELCPSGFLNLILKDGNFQNELHSNIVQAVQANISLSMISAQKFVFPPTEQIGKIFSSIENILKMQGSNYTENQILAKLRDTLLPKLMNGEISVKDAESEVEAAI